MTTRQEAEKFIPMNGASYDVIVCGAGASGLAAAISSARNGAKTLLIEARSALGGNIQNTLWMCVNRLWRYHGHTRGGVHQMLIDKMKSFGEFGAIENIPNPLEYDNLDMHPDYLRLATYQMLEECGCHYHVHGMVTDVIMEKNTIRGVVITGKGGHEVFYGKVIIDATGDADVAYLSGVETTKGRPSDGALQPIALVFAIANCDVQRLLGFLKDRKPNILPKSVGGQTPDEKASMSKEKPLIGMDPLKKIIGEAKEKGYSTAKTYRFDLTTVPGVLSINNVLDYGSIDGTSMRDLTVAERLAIEMPIDFIKIAREWKIPGLENCYLMRVGTAVATRETRRIVGEYRWTGQDAINGTEFEDTIARCYEGVIDTAHYLVDAAYDASMPYRMMLPIGVENLLVTGKCCSTDYEGYAANRGSGNVIGLGQAAGAAAAISVKNRVTPRKADVKEIQGALRNMGVKLEKGL